MWAAPETLMEARRSKEADVFSYGLVAIEVRPIGYPFFPCRPPYPDMEWGVPLGPSYCNPSDDQYYFRSASSPTRERKSTWPNHEALGRSDDVLAREPEGSHSDLRGPQTPAFHVSILFSAGPKCYVFAHRMIQDLVQGACTLPGRKHQSAEQR